MRIAYIAQSYPPMMSGAASVARCLAQGMALRGHIVLVIAASDRGEAYETLDQNLTVIRLRSYKNPLRVNQNFSLYPRRAALKVLREFKPDVIHSHDSLQLAQICLQYGRAVNIPVLLTIHALPSFVAAYFSGMPVLKKWVEASLWSYAAWLIQKFDKVITPTQTTSDQVAFMTGVRPQTISNGVDLTQFTPAPLRADQEAALRARLNLPLGVPVILYVGRLDKEKRVDRVVMAAAQAMRGNSAHLLVVGDGTESGALMRKCARLGIDDRCRFPGAIHPQDGLPEIYRLAALFVTASEIETQGIVLLEAAASGLPIVAGRVTCIPELVHDGVNGLLTAPGNINGLGQAIHTMLNDPARSQMGLAGRSLAMAHEIQRTLILYENCYHEALLDLRGGAPIKATRTLSIRKWIRRAFSQSTWLS